MLSSVMYGKLHSENFICCSLVWFLFIWTLHDFNVWSCVAVRQSSDGPDWTVYCECVYLPLLNCQNKGTCCSLSHQLNPITSATSFASGIRPTRWGGRQFPRRGVRERPEAAGEIIVCSSPGGRSVDLLLWPGEAVVQIGRVNARNSSIKESRRSFPLRKLSWWVESIECVLSPPSFVCWGHRVRGRRRSSSDGSMLTDGHVRLLLKWWLGYRNSRRWTLGSDYAVVTDSPAGGQAQRSKSRSD